MGTRKGGLLLFQFFLIAGIVCIILSGILIGAWSDGEQQRAIYYTETPKDRRSKTKAALISGLLGIVFFVISGIIYYFFKK